MAACSLTARIRLIVLAAIVANVALAILFMAIAIMAAMGFG
jgi:hypothetical protein